VINFATYKNKRKHVDKKFEDELWNSIS